MSTEPIFPEDSVELIPVPCTSARLSCGVLFRDHACADGEALHP